MENGKVVSLQAFLQPVTHDEVEYVASRRFKDADGKPVAWKIKPIGVEENNALIKACTRNMPVPGKKGTFAPEVDYGLYSVKLSVACTVFPPLDDAALQNAQGVMGAEALFGKLLLLGEQAAYSAKVREVNGFDEDFEELVDDAKN